MHKEQAWNLYFDAMHQKELGHTTSALQTALISTGGSEHHINYLLPFLAWPAALKDEDLQTFTAVTRARKLNFRREMFKLHFFVNDLPLPDLPKSAPSMKRPVFSLKCQA